MLGGQAGLVRTGQKWCFASAANRSDADSSFCMYFSKYLVQYMYYISIVGFTIVCMPTRQPAYGPHLTSPHLTLVWKINCVSTI